MLEYLKPRLFAKLDNVNTQWHTCQFGHTSCSGGLYLTTEEFSRIGITLLQNGVYKDQQIVPADYVKRMHSDWVDSSAKNDPDTKGGYGYLVWKCTPPDTYRADGMYGQLCVVLKGYNAMRLNIKTSCAQSGQTSFRTYYLVIYCGPNMPRN